MREKERKETHKCAAHLTWWAIFRLWDAKKQRKKKSCRKKQKKTRKEKTNLQPPKCFCYATGENDIFD